MIGHSGGGHFDDSGDAEKKPHQARPKHKPSYNTRVRKRKRRSHGRAHMMRASGVDRVKQ
jgi:hypothetical protein